MTNGLKRNTTAFFLLALFVTAGVFGCGTGGGDYSTGAPQHFFGPTKLVVTPDKLDLRGIYLYAINGQGDTLTVMETKFRTIIKHHSFNEDRKDIVFLGGAPNDIAITEDGNTLYITDALDGVLRKVEAHSPFRMTVTDLVIRAARIVIPETQINSRTDFAYLTSPDTLELIRIAIADDGDVETGRVALPGQPIALTVSPDGETLAVTTEEGDLIFVDVATFQVLPELTIYLSGRPGNLTTDAQGDFYFVLNNDPPQVQVVDGSTFELTEDEITFDLPLGNLTRSTNGDYIYISSQGGEVFVFSTKVHRACGASYDRVYFKDRWPQSNPTLTDVEVFDCVTRDEKWEIKYVSKTDEWEVYGSHTGLQLGRAKTNQYYVSDDGTVGFRILQGNRYPSDRDMFYFEVKGGWEPVRVGKVPDGLAVAPYWKDPDFDLVFVANTGTHNVSVIYSEEFVNVGAVN